MMEIELTLPIMVRMVERIKVLTGQDTLTEDECEKIISFLNEIELQIKNNSNLYPDGPSMITHCKYAEFLLVLRVTTILEGNVA